MRGSAVLALLFVAVSAFGGDALTCTGSNVSEQELIRRFGRKNVVREAVYVAEGAEERGTVVFPNDAARRMEIVWREGQRYRRPEWMRVPEGSRWSFAGLESGMTLTRVEQLNGRAFVLSGFDWDFGGAVTDWRGGRLATAGAPCTLALHFDRVVPDSPTAAEEKAIEATSGDRELSSSSKDLRRFSVVVREIVIQYPQ